jgi:transcriptional regulator with XRE-family HTH domain
MKRSVSSWYKMATYPGIKVTMAVPPESQRHALGDFLRTHRARLAPASLGFAPGRRRTPGLRREEVAQVCGMSATWYTWLEQGRDVSPSPQALAALARALQLTPAERGYLFQLGARRDPAEPAPPDDGAMDATPALAEAVAAIDTPAYVLDRTWTARAWNDQAARLFVGWLDGAHDRNLMRYIFLSPLAAKVIPDWESRARRVLAEFRAESSRHLDDAALRTVVEELREKSPLFARHWSEHEVVDLLGGARRFDHPREGPLLYEQIAFTLASRPDLKLVILMPRPALQRPSTRRSEEPRPRKRG